MDGTITVVPFAAYGEARRLVSYQATLPQEPGLGADGRSAHSGELNSIVAEITYGGGGGGTTFNAHQNSSPFATAILRFGPVGGGGGGASRGRGGAGGGTITVLAAGPVVIGSGGAIHADGENAQSVNNGTLKMGGGGGGGAIVLASMSSVSVSGGLSVVGGDGANGGNDPTDSVSFGAGGAGAGGIIHLLSPTIDEADAHLAYAKGACGGLWDTTAAYASRVGGGGGGGGLSGTGSPGGHIKTGASAEISSFGTSYCYAETGVRNLHVCDPTSLF